MSQAIREIVRLLLIEKGPLWEPPCDIFEHKGVFTIELEITDLDTNKLSININDGKKITITGVKHKTIFKSSNYLRAERFFGSFKKQLDLPCSVRLKNIDYSDGILKITLIKE
ncbi:Hsp20/alpha crystallin family protein [Hippea maritima]|uniref:Heat shock protein Hsp20 n=1 Tax=Hippea maritima (strain ATCC 700847 / DSM 10411 / MH2) TaxID=760142 RepID=F2LXD1_HIPMA|nr:Hsp20/alpha crystallin family protein [Hippea maritima]AEA34245.1 heat shock protein Hsp20 [Hippea maritima DSM 10411]